MKRVVVVLVGGLVAAYGPSPAYEPARPTAAETRCQRGERIFLSTHGLHNGTDRPVADVERIVRAALEKHVSGRTDVELTNGAHIDGRCELDVALRLEPIEPLPGKVVVRGAADVVENGSRSKRGGLDKKLTADIGADNAKATEDLVLAKAIDVLVGTVVANLRAFAEGAPDAAQGPP